ncbi:MAG: hypothetical protein AAF618_08205 [Pseudomonadota bacterium]
MDFSDVSSLLRQSRSVFAKGPVALIFLEDDVACEATVVHHLNAGFQTVVAFVSPDVPLGDELSSRITTVEWNAATDEEPHEIVNLCIAAAPPIWFYYCFNAEFLYFPFCETRSVGEVIAFTTEERRESILTYVIDLYADDLGRYPNAVSLEDAYLDRSGYYALARKDDWDNPLERQMDFYGGLRWRMEEHIPKKRRKIDRVALFKSKKGLTLSEDHTFNDAEYNTYACPWHHNVTAAICSFRTAKALKRNPGSTFDIETFRWHNSVRFEWHSQQLMQLGLMEPGQWF